MSEVLDGIVPIGRYRTKKRIDKRELLSSHHTRRLDSLRAVLGEMGRVYRSTINGSISTGDGLRLSKQLAEIRCCMEAVSAAEAAEIGRQRPAGHINTINILAVESGQIIDPVSGKISWHATELPTELPTEQPQIAPAEPIDREFTPQTEPTPQLSELEAKLLAMDHAQLLELAEALNVGR